MVNMERIHNDFGMITFDNVDPRGVDQQSTWKVSMITLEGSPLTMLIWGVNQQSTWKGSMMTLEGSPLTMLILGEGKLIDGQLGKDLQ